MNWDASAKALTELALNRKDAAQPQLELEPEVQVALPEPEPEVMTTALFGWS